MLSRRQWLIDGSNHNHDVYRRPDWAIEDDWVSSSCIQTGWNWSLKSVCSGGFLSGCLGTSKSHFQFLSQKGGEVQINKYRQHTESAHLCSIASIYLLSGYYFENFPRNIYFSTITILIIEQNLPSIFSHPPIWYKQSTNTSIPQLD